MVIETAMWFALGFLAAAVLGLVLMASLWRRAVRLTTRRIVASVPADAEAALAEKDLLAARFARDVRRFELSLSDLRRRNVEERVAVERGTAALEAMRAERDAETARIAEGALRETALAEEIAVRDREIAARQADLEAARATIAANEEAIADLEAAIAGRDRQIEDLGVEVAARKTEVSARHAQIMGLDAELSERRTRIEDLRKTLGLAETVVAQEKDRANRLDRRIERLVADVADREEVAERRQRELERSRQALASANARIAALTRRGGDGEGPRIGDNVDRSVDLLEQQMRDLENRLETVEAERDRLAAAVGERRRDAGGPGDPTRARLRDEIADLAAEMVRLTGAVEHGDATIAALLDQPGADEGPRPSLADRIRAVRAAAQNANAKGRDRTA